MTVHCATLMDICQLKKMWSQYQNFKTMKAGMRSEVTRWKTIHAPTVYAQNRVRLHLEWRPQK